ncbi:MAG: hypothetical protein J6D02_04945 [Lachnospira sp.]|nr:hypothetical protein [Lachnospira sp.]
MDINEFKRISLNGRVSYSIRCFENLLFYLDYNVEDWEIVLEYLWQFTSIKYLDDWNGIISEIIPENLLEFMSYEEHDFEYLDEDTFRYLYKLYQNIDGKIDYLMSAIYYIGASHSYSVIQGYGQASFNRLTELINYMVKNHIPLPDIDSFRRFSIEENRGWGNKFDGRILSKII